MTIPEYLGILSARTARWAVAAPPLPRRRARALVWAVSFLLAIMAAIGASLMDIPRHGGDGWWQLAGNIYGSGAYAFVQGGDFATFRGPLYPAMLVAALLTPVPHYAMALLQALLFSMAGVAVLEAGTTISGRLLSGIVCWFLWIVYPYHYFYIFYATITLPAILLVSLIAWSFARILAQPSTKDWVIFGILGAAGALTYTIVLVLYLILLGFAFLYQRSWRSALLSAIVAFLIYLPWGALVYHNSAGTAFLSSDPVGLNYFAGNQNILGPLALVKPVPKSDPAVRDLVVLAGGPVRGAYWLWDNDVFYELNRMAVEHALEHPLYVVGKVLKQAPMLWYVSQRHHPLIQVAAVSTIAYVLMAVWAIVRRRSAFGIAVGVALGMMTLLYALTLAYVRYAVALVPLLCLVGGEWLAWRLFGDGLPSVRRGKL